MIPDQARRALVEKLGDRLAFDVPLSAHTSLRIGGTRRRDGDAG